MRGVIELLINQTTQAHVVLLCNAPRKQTLNCLLYVHCEDVGMIQHLRKIDLVA